MSRCQAWDGVTVEGERPTCADDEATAQIRHPHGGTTLLCADCLAAWLDNADEDPSIEPAALRVFGDVRMEN